MASPRSATLLTMSGMDTLELVSRLQHSDLDEATLTALRVTTERLCSEHAFQPADGRGSYLAASHQRAAPWHAHDPAPASRSPRFAGWITLLLACVEHDTGDRKNAETTRQASLCLAADHGEIEAWARAGIRR